MRALTILFVAAWTAPALAQSDTAFTYQGELMDSGAPANGAYLMHFSLWDAADGGNQMGGFVSLPGVPVTKGLFTVELDFGASVLDGGPRWLNIEIGAIELEPRIRITRSPYSIQTRGIFVNDAGQIGIGTTDPQRDVDIEGAEPVLRLTATDPAAGKTGRLQFKGSAGPSLFHPFGMLEFFDHAGDLLATISAHGSGPGAAHFNFSVTPGSPAQMRVFASGVQFQNGIRPPVAYGKVSGTVLEAGSTNVDSIAYLDWINGGEYEVTFAEPLLDDDIPIATLRQEGLIKAYVSGGRLYVTTYSPASGHPQADRDFSFVIYRP